MKDKCKHKTSVQLFSQCGLAISKCEWGCGELLISWDEEDGMITEMTLSQMIEAVTKSKAPWYFR
jgi:hypothetical protein